MALDKNTLALDLGTKTGWAVSFNYVDVRRVVESGAENFSTTKKKGPGLRYLNFSRWLDYAVDFYEIEEIYYEDVRRHLGTQAAHVYGGFEAITLMCAEINKIPCKGIGVKLIKKSWCGNGNASKEAMTKEARKRGLDIRDDNQVDAVALLEHVLGGMR